MSDGERARLEEALRRVDALATALDQVSDAGTREAARELLELVLDLHGLALARTMAILASATGGRELVQRLAQDETVRAALLLHGLHPDPIEERVGKAVERLRPQLEILGCRVRLVEATAEMARLRVESAQGPEALRELDLRQRIETAIFDAAPDIEEIMIDGLGDAGVEPAAMAAD